MTAVRYEARHGVATLTLAEPENKNALNARIINGLGDGLSAAAADEAVRVIVLTHEGTTFCAGADLKGGGPAQTPRYSFPDVLAGIQDSPKPVVAVLRGHCMGGGVGLAAAADLSVASTDVTFGFTEVRIGVAPAMISVVCLPKLSRADAAELFLTGRRIPAAQAAEVGLINRAVEPAELDQEVSGLLDEIVAGGPRALAASKRLLSTVPTMSRSEAFEFTQTLSTELFRSSEAGEGIAAFRERRPPAWIPS
ncbi:enoyl-CoA hydratase-related protein [Dactylosporangium sucinum]|uniref:Enoyl-CoA hydratase n=1 Tax=Dactylosporangium sucinum TaxID=1424081 RepID=A0A917UCQ4_9ACTN|nr:enoyl-CoA hydratase-related protein [Dactylosporangium sucinum]GGM82712.1 enoyl-CoA hydratase [Dactylosporangium sucinum]